MTSTITILCPEGVVLGADRYITFPMNPDRSVLHHECAEKIYLSKKTNVGISYWGLGSFGSTKIIDFLKQLDKTLNSNDSVDEIASALENELKTQFMPKVDKRCGFHVAGYSRSTKKPRLRHVFHESWHDAGQFTDEDCHWKFHTKNGHTVTYRYERDYLVLFNGDNFIANVLFNLAPTIRPDIRIIPRQLSLKECIELVDLIISTSINRLDYYFDLSKFKKIEPDVGGGVSILVIRPGAYEWIKRGA